MENITRPCIRWILKRPAIPYVVNFFVIMSVCSAGAADLPNQHQGNETVVEQQHSSFRKQQGAVIPDQKGSIGQEINTVDSVHEQATSLLFNTALWLDSFFDDDRSLAEENKTRATFSLSLGYSKDDEFEIEPRIKLRLQLPKLSKRAQLIIAGSDDEDFDVEDNPLSGGPNHGDEETRDVTATLRYFLLEGEKYNVAVDAGASWTYVFASVRYRAIHSFGSWQGRFTDRIKWYSDDGWENKASYDLETDFNEKFFFRASTIADVYEKQDGIPHGQIFKLFQVLSPLKAVSYEVGFYFDIEPEYSMTDAALIVKYRQRFYRDWLILEISPRLNFPEDNDYEANPGIIFKLEATFGYDANKESYKAIFKK